MLTRNDLAAYIADNYGTCARGTDCYWGKDASGNWNGCLKVAWLGVACPHWHPIEARDWDELKAAQVAANGQLIEGSKPCK